MKKNEIQVGDFIAIERSTGTRMYGCVLDTFHSKIRRRRQVWLQEDPDVDGGRWITLRPSDVVTLEARDE